MLKLLFLGRLEDVAGTPDMAIPLSQHTPLGEVLRMLPPHLAEALAGPRVKLALNGVLVAPAGLILAPADELAFLPPVSGG